MPFFAKTITLKTIEEQLKAGKNADAVASMKKFSDDRQQRHKAYAGYAKNVALLEQMHQDEIDRVIDRMKVNDYGNALKKVGVAQDYFKQLSKMKENLDKEHKKLLERVG